LNRTIVPQSTHIELSPFAFQWYAGDFFDAYQKITGGPRFSPARLTLLAQACELAAKSLHVAQGKTDDDLRKLGHNIVRACDAAILNIYEISLTPDEERELGKLNALNKLKAFEYFWFPWQGSKPEIGGIMHALLGRKDLPDENIVQGLVAKLLAPKL